MLVIKNADIITMTEAGMLRGDILIDQGIIQRVGPDIQPTSGAQLLDASGLVALPGFVDAHSHAGCFGGGRQSGNEASAAVNAELDIFNSITPGSDFGTALRCGVTTTGVLPGASTILGGLGCVVKTYGENAKQMLMVRKACMKGSFSLSVNRLFGGSPGGPATVMGHAWQLRQWLTKAHEYAKNRGSQPKDSALENLALVIEKKIPLRVHCESYNIINTIRIAEEFDILFTLEHAFGASAFVDEIIAAKGLLGVVFGPLYFSQMPGISKEVKNTMAITLHNHGIPVAIMSDYFPDINCGTLVFQAGELVRNGCDIQTVLEMLTLNPARILGVDERVGSIEAGKDADIILFSALPAVDTSARLMHVIAGGNIVN